MLTTRYSAAQNRRRDWILNCGAARSSLAWPTADTDRIIGGSSIPNMTGLCIPRHYNHWEQEDIVRASVMAVSVARLSW